VGNNTLSTSALETPARDAEFDELTELLKDVKAVAKGASTSVLESCSTRVRFHSARVAQLK
jgi:hypothetical protein